LAAAEKTSRLDIATDAGVFLNTGHRAFTQVANTLPFTGATTVGDFNGDGKDDVVTADPSGTIYISYSRGDGTFYLGTTLNPEQYVGGMVVGDFDGDGRLDLAVGLAGSNQVALFFNQSNGQFTRSFFASGANTFAMRGADLNGDGKIDLVFVSFGLDFYPPNVDVIFHK